MSTGGYKRDVPVLMGCHLPCFELYGVVSELTQVDFGQIQREISSLFGLFQHSARRVGNAPTQTVKLSNTKLMGKERRANTCSLVLYPFFGV